MKESKCRKRKCERCGQPTKSPDPYCSRECRRIDNPEYLESDMPDVIDPTDIRKMTIAEVMDQCYKTALDKGWWEDHNHTNPDNTDKIVAQKVLLIISEVTEAFEHLRYGHDLEDVFLDDGKTQGMIEPTSPYEPGVGGKPDGFAVELADAIVRIFDLCGRMNLPILEALAIKMAYNETRSHRHGGKKA